MSKVDGSKYFYKLFDELERHFAYDEGATDSGVHDPVRRADLAAQLTMLDERDVRLELSRWVRKAYLSDAALARGYGWEDALRFLRWFDEDL